MEEYRTKSDILATKHEFKSRISRRIDLVCRYLQGLCNMGIFTFLLIFIFFDELGLIYVSLSLAGISLTLSLLFLWFRPDLAYQHFAVSFYFRQLHQSLKNAVNETEAFCNIINALSLDESVQSPPLTSQYLRLNRQQTSKFLVNEPILGSPKGNSYTTGPSTSPFHSNRKTFNVERLLYERRVPVDQKLIDT